MKKILVNSPERCTGCRLCEAVCSLAHEGECNPAKSRIQIARWEIEGIDIPLFCMHCDDAACAEVCPKNAIKRNPETGAMIIDRDLCIGCRMCSLTCPFGAIGFNTETRSVFKCDLCDGDPQCVTLCHTKAIEFVPAERFVRNRINRAATQFEVFRNAQISE